MKPELQFSVRRMLLVTAVVAVAAAVLSALSRPSEHTEILAILATFALGTIVPLVLLQVVIRFCPRIATKCLLFVGLLLVPLAALIWDANPIWGGASALGGLFCLLTAALIYFESRRG